MSARTLPVSSSRFCRAAALALPLVLLAGALLIQPGRAGATPINFGPPSGAILDLAGTAIPDGYQQYSVTFVAGSANTDLTFALRTDPGYFALDDISLYDNSSPSGNLVVNGGFEAGLTGWTDDNIYGAAFAGMVDSTSSCGGTDLTHDLTPHSGSSEWCDGSVQAYDAIDQNIATVVGDSYTVSFWLNSADATGTYPVPPNFQQLSTNGDTFDASGDGIDVLVFAQSALPPASGTPEPGSLLLLATGLLLGVSRRQRQSGLLRRVFSKRVGSAVTTEAKTRRLTT